MLLELKDVLRVKRHRIELEFAERSHFALKEIQRRDRPARNVVLPAAILERWPVNDFAAWDRVFGAVGPDELLEALDAIEDSRRAAGPDLDLFRRDQKRRGLSYAR